MAIHNLKTGGEIIYIIPRSWTSGAYFAKFREYLFSNCVITHLHLFSSRDKVFDGESVLQETIIVKVKKNTKHPNVVRITSSSTSDFSDISTFEAPYNIVVSSQQYVYLVTAGSHRRPWQRRHRHLHRRSLPVGRLRKSLAFFLTSRHCFAILTLRLRVVMYLGSYCSHFLFFGLYYFGGK